MRGEPPLQLRIRLGRSWTRAEVIAKKERIARVRLTVDAHVDVRATLALGLAEQPLQPVLVNIRSTWRTVVAHNAGDLAEAGDDEAVRGRELRHRHLDVDRVLCRQAGNRRRADVVNPAGRRAERRTDAHGHCTEVVRPSLRVRDDLRTAHAVSVTRGTS